VIKQNVPVAAVKMPAPAELKIFAVIVPTGPIKHTLAVNSDALSMESAEPVKKPAKRAPRT